MSRALPSVSFSLIFRVMQDSLAAASGPHLWPMTTTQFLKTRVPPQTKALVQAAAEREYLTEATWFRRAIEAALRNGSDSVRHGMEPFTDGRSRVTVQEEAARLSVRLQGDDRMMLKDRAAARGMAPATYASVLLRSHLRNLQPLPRDELSALKRTVSELGAIGRNLNQIARAVNQSERSAGASREDLRALIKVCEVLRVHVKDIVKANVTSWAVGYGDSSR